MMDPILHLINSVVDPDQYQYYKDPDQYQYYKMPSKILKIRVGIKKPTQKNPPKKTQKNPPKKTH